MSLHAELSPEALERLKVQQRNSTISSIVTRKPTPPTTNLAKVIISNTASPTSVQVPNVDVSTSSMDFGNVEDFGANWGEAEPSGFGNVPNLFEVTQKAGQFIIDNQHKKSGGWDYLYDTTGGRGGVLSLQMFDKGSEKGIRAVAPAFVGTTHYRTALCTLMLEVYYRFLPGTGVGTR